MAPNMKPTWAFSLLARGHLPLLDMHGQLTAKGHAVAYIQLTPAETKYYSSFPIKDNLELGYFFPPQEDGIFKMAHSQFITNMQTNKNSNITTSIPHTFVQAPHDGLPLEIEAQMRRNLRRVLPELADRPFCYTRLCWDADTADRHFLITPLQAIEVYSSLQGFSARVYIPSRHWEVCGSLARGNTGPAYFQQMAVARWAEG
jgi:glycine/D-amino acid oxidase-like deaminating enzyme